MFPPANTGFTSAIAHEITKFQYVDLDYRHNLWGCDCTCVNYFIGMRYAQLEQEFDSVFTDAFVGGMATAINFDGVGLRVGLDGERAFRGGFYTTAKFDANFIGGEFEANYAYATNNPAAIPLTTSWNEVCFTAILEAEVAVGWQSANGRIRATVGYLVTDWCNAVKPAEYINAVQQNSFHGGNQLGTTAAGVRRFDRPRRVGLVEGAFCYFIKARCASEERARAPRRRVGLRLVLPAGRPKDAAEARLPIAFRHARE